MESWIEYAWYGGKGVVVWEKFTSMYKDRFQVVIPKVLLFYAIVLLIPPQLRCVLNMIELHGIA